MNYYEELGIRPDADEEEIRKAHRRLVKLMHPDQHRDQGLKQLAETQMRRLNSIVATLLDPEQRQEYDEQLRGGGEGAGGPIPKTASWRSIPWWIASTLVAIVLTVAAVWFWADRFGGLNGNPQPAIVEGPDKGASSGNVDPLPRPKQEETVVHVPPPVNAKPEEQPQQEVKVAPAPTAPLGTDHKTAPVDAAKSGPPPMPPPAVVQPPAVKPQPTPPPPPQRASVKPPATVAVSQQKQPAPKTPSQTLAVKTPATKPAPPVAVAQVSTPPASTHRRLDSSLLNNPTLQSQIKRSDVNLSPPPTTVPVSPHEVDGITATPVAPIYPEPGKALPVDGHRDPLEGEWVYAPTEPEKRRSGFYPPEFISLRLVKQPDGMHGQYSARYNIADAKPVSPEVSFSMRAVDKTFRRYVWTSADGNRGTADIRSVEADTMRIEWKLTNQKGNGPVLSSGVATLVRRN